MNYCELQNVSFRQQLFGTRIKSLKDFRFRSRRRAPRGSENPLPQRHFVIQRNLNQKPSSTSPAVDVLSKGGVVVYPTETAYGLGADATNPRAVERVFGLKGRARTKSVLLLMKDIAMVKRYALVNKKEAQLMKLYWPEALTIVLRVKPRLRSMLARGVVAKDGTIAVRVSSHKVARALIKGLGKPLVSTSANRAGGATVYSVAGVQKQLGAHFRAAQFPCYIYDDGVLPRRKVSTIVKVCGGRIEVLRHGAVKILC